MTKCGAEFFIVLGLALFVARQLLEIVGAHTSPAGTKNEGPGWN